AASSTSRRWATRRWNAICRRGNGGTTPGRMRSARRATRTCASCRAVSPTSSACHWSRCAAGWRGWKDERSPGIACWRFTVPLRTEDYALIGDCLSCALVSRTGSIDWACLPYFDSPACFAALLGTEEHGYWRIAPRDGEPVSRRYRDGTLILETDFRT